MVVCKYFQAGYCRYGQSCRFEHVYGSKYSYRASQSTGNQTSNNNGLTNSSSNHVAASIFRGAAQQPTHNQSIFGQSPQNRGSVFDRLGTQQHTNNTNSQAKSIFAQASQTYSSPPNNNFFTQRVDPKSVFAQASHNVFGNSQPPLNNISAPSPPQQAPNPANVFASAASTFFGQKVDHSPTGNIFQRLETPANQPFNHNLEQVCEDEGVYSKIESLSESELEAFQSGVFKLGYIPDVPPPKSLCV